MLITSLLVSTCDDPLFVKVKFCIEFRLAHLSIVVFLFVNLNHLVVASDSFFKHVVLIVFRDTATEIDLGATFSLHGIDPGSVLTIDI